MRDYPQSDDTMRWVRRGSVLAALLIGWVFILVTNNFHITPPVVFVCLGYLAAVAAIYTLYRLGATAVTETSEEDDAMSWVKPLGALDELEREKRALLKAIKEAEFDQQMGKLSKADAESMIGVYRARAIEVIKEIDVQNSTSGQAGTVRERILREARARIHVEEKSKDVPAKKKKADKKSKSSVEDRADKLADAVSSAATPAEKVKAAEPEDVLTDSTDDKAADKPAGEKFATPGDDKPADKPVAKTDDKSAAKPADDMPAAKAADDKASADKPAADKPAADKPAAKEATS